MKILKLLLLFILVPPIHAASSFPSSNMTIVPNSDPTTLLNSDPTMRSNVKHIFPQDATPLPPTAWYKIGGAFGPVDNSGSRGWQFGFDTSATAGACIAYLINDKEFLGGACRDFFILTHHKENAIHLGGMFGWDSSHAHSAALGRLGVNIGPTTAGSLNLLADKIPLLESLSNVAVPSFLSYIGKITTIDFAAGSRSDTKRFVYGIGIKADVPISDLFGSGTK